MSKCDLNVVIDERSAVFKVGEPITGRVDVLVDKECTCNGLSVTLEWRTHGRGNCDQGGRTEIDLFSGTWLPGERLSYPFELKAPAGPVSYHGHDLNVDWYVSARADIPWAFDPKDELEVFLVAGDGAVPIDHGPGYRPPKEQHQDRDCGNARLFATVYGVLVTLGFALMLLRGFSVSLVLFLVLFPFVFLSSLPQIFRDGRRTLRNWLARKRLGEIEVRSDAWSVRAGDSLECAVRFQPLKDVDVDRIDVTLRGREEVVSGSGTSRTTHRHQIYESTVTLTSGTAVHAGEWVEVKGRAPIPPDAPVTFMAGDNKLLWSIVVHISVAGCPGWKRDYAISVEPAEVGTAQSCKRSEALHA